MLRLGKHFIAITVTRRSVFCVPLFSSLIYFLENHRFWMYYKLDHLSFSKTVHVCFASKDNIYLKFLKMLGSLCQGNLGLAFGLE